MICHSGARLSHDLYQFENNIKPDYSNCGGTQWNHPEFTNGEWEDLDEDTAEEYGLI